MLLENKAEQKNKTKKTGSSHNKTITFQARVLEWVAISFSKTVTTWVLNFD